MDQIPPEELTELIGTQLAQTHLVFKCLARAIARQPNIDKSKFLSDLADEEQHLSEKCSTAKDVVRMIIAEAEGYE